MDYEHLLEMGDKSLEKIKSTECYTIDGFKEIGTGIVISLLDMREANPISRLFSSPFKNLKVRITCANEN